VQRRQITSLLKKVLQSLYLIYGVGGVWVWGGLVAGRAAPNSDAKEGKKRGLHRSLLEKKRPKE